MHNPTLFTKLTPTERSIAIQRLTALWALNECGLGGFLHAIQSPVSGLLLGSIAMTCIAFICVLSERKWSTVMSCLVIVLIIKALVSPHSSPTAYIAVTFQAVTGAIIFSNIKYLPLAAILFLIIGLLESGLQKVFTLTILYGNTLWESIDLWGVWVSEQWNIILPFSSARLIIYTYLFIHFIAGLIVGWFVYRAVIAINRLWGQTQYKLHLHREDRKNVFPATIKKGTHWKKYLLFIILAMIIIWGYFIQPEKGGISKGLISIARAIAILLLWYVFLAPLIMKLLQSFLRKKQSQLSAQVAQTMDMLPHLAWILEKAWKETEGQSFFKRWKPFAIHTLLYILQYTSTYDPDPDRAHPEP